jgi:hypothetical protein
MEGGQCQEQAELGRVEFVFHDDDKVEDFDLAFEKPIETIARWRIDNDKVDRAVVLDSFDGHGPGRGSQVCVLLKDKPCRK